MMSTGSGGAGGQFGSAHGSLYGGGGLATNMGSLQVMIVMIVMMMMAQWPHHYLRITEITLLRSHYFSLCQCQVAAAARIQIQRTRPPALETEYYLHNFIAAKMLYTNFLWLARMIDGVLREREITI